MELVVDNSTGGDDQLANSVATGLRDRGFSVELRERSPTAITDTSVNLVTTGRSDLGTIEEVVRAALMSHSTPRRRTRAVPVALGWGGRVLTWIDVFG
jgi:hypothetical protein